MDMLAGSHPLATSHCLRSAFFFSGEAAASRALVKILPDAEALLMTRRSHLYVKE